MTTLVYAALLTAGLALLAVTAVRVLVGGLGPPGGATQRSRQVGEGARRILDERYAAGELSTEEYHHRRRVLEEGGS